MGFGAAEAPGVKRLNEQDRFVLMGTTTLFIGKNR